jgi:hypothetical protein
LFLNSTLFWQTTLHLATRWKVLTCRIREKHKLVVPTSIIPCRNRIRRLLSRIWPWKVKPNQRRSVFRDRRRPPSTTFGLLFPEMLVKIPSTHIKIPTVTCILLFVLLLVCAWCSSWDMWAQIKLVKPRQHWLVI